MTLPEVLMWQQLRQRPQGLKFRRQFPIGPYVADFACLSERLLVEVDGAAAHDGAARAAHDAKRTAYLSDRGYRVIRVSAADVLRDLDAVMRYIVSQGQI